LAEFTCVSLSPIELGASIALATIRAGGVAVLDAELCPAETIAAAEATMRGVPGAGLRLHREQIAGCAALLKIARGPIVLAGWTADDVVALARDGREIWIEILSSDELARIDDSLPIAAIVARGNECGGRAGRESAFILAQHLSRQDKHRFFIQGGIGVHSAAACRVAGAAGVVLDDALMLMRDSSLPQRWRGAFERIGPADTAVVDGRRIVNRPDFAAAPAGWGDPSERAWPVGESAGRARELAARYGTVGRYLRAIVDESARHVADAAAHQPLAEGSLLARSHGTRYPIVQGPMTRVSDRAEFAAAVAEGGALPLVALALMRGPEVESLLRETQRTLADRPWGIGILGFVPRDLWEEQLAVVEQLRPPFALIAGGRPDHAARLEALGVATYLHAPAAVLPMFLEQGSRRFIFEGGECGGHVGPLHSFTLWEIAIDRLLAQSDSESIHAVFAGGIHDALSAAMVAAMAAPLAARGMRAGVLMGTAYLFADESVKSGAITQTFQRQAVGCTNTLTIETKAGHAIRCVPTPFTETFARTRTTMAQTVSAPELGDALEQLIVGRSRVASKGLQRRGDAIESVDEAHQLAEGMFMIGEVATLRSGTTKIAALHDDVSAGGARLLDEAAAAAVAPPKASAKPASVAIVGVGCLLPGAQDADALWRNLLDRVDCIREIPPERWDWRLYYDADPSAPDRIYSKWGSFIDPLPFDPLHYGIPPKSLPSIALPQLLALETTRRALRDAGYGDWIEDERLRERTAVIFGTGNTGDVEQMYMARSALPLVSGDGDDARRRLPEWTEESYPGILVNVVAGRVANRFDLGGPNLTLDAACASSFAALDLAVRELEEGRSDLVLAGGIEFEQTTQAYMAFSKTKAFSPRGKARVFDAGADGIVIGEGAVVFALKRLDDAERDGDRVYGVIRAVAGSSDGKGLGLTAPKPAGQRRALRRAHAQAGIDTASLGMYEAHGTGTAVGDAAELETISVALRQAGAAPRSCAIGSAKSIIGHTRATAGMVGLLKAALALRHRVLPPHAGVEEPMKELRDPASPLRVADTAQPWLDGDGPRRAGVSAFGFGGTNFHVVIEEARDARAAAGANRWPCELFVLDEDDLERVERAIGRVPLADLAYTCAANAGKAQRRIAVVAANDDELRRGIANARASEPAPAGEIAFLFPGQGSQSIGMAGELALYFDEVRRALEEGERITGAPLARRIFPPQAFSEETRTDDERALADTRVAQPAIGAVSCGILDLARRLGVEPSRVAGHSYGEFVALHAAGALTRDELLRLSKVRGAVMAATDAGAMAMVVADADSVSPHLDDDVVIANHNAPDQIVLSGAVEAIERAVAALTANGFTARRLNVSGAFHSTLMQSARAPFAEFVATLAPAAPRIPVHANLDGEPYPLHSEEIRRRLVEHLEQPVAFVSQIESLYAAGVRTFVEIGPGHVLTSLVRRILGDRPHLALSSDGGMRGWLQTLGALWTGGAPLDPAALHDGREVRYVDLDRLAPEPAAPAWMIDGGRVWRTDAASRNFGELPLLDADSASQLVPRVAHEDPLVAAYREYEETMRRFLEQQERVLMQVVGGDGARALPQPPSQPALEARREPLAIAAAPESIPAFDRDGITQRLIAVVSDRTGYPAAMLDVNQNLEAELGIDSIKRIEIVGALQKALPAELAGALQSRFDELVRAKSLSSLADAVMRIVPTAPIAVAKVETPACPRFVMQGQARELADPRRETLEGLFLVTQDHLGAAEAVVARLRETGATASLVRHADLVSDEALEERVLVLRHMHGAVTGIVHLGALGQREAEEIERWRDDTAGVAKRFFRLLQLCAQEPDDERALQDVVAVTQFGGEWGRAHVAPGTAAAGAAHGLLRTLQSELPRVRTKVVDFDESIAADDLAERVVDEILAGGDGEVGYAGDRRLAYTTAAAPLDRSAAFDFRPRAGAVVLVTGGARGITAEVCRELAAPGVRFVLVGRTPLGEHVESEQEIDAMRQALLAALHAPAPSEIRRIDNLVRERRQERERHLSLASLRDAGAEVEYHALDVRDELAFAELLDGIYQRHGRIDAVVHGAGIIEDQWIEKKEADSFDRVFDTKADSAWLLARHLRPESLRWIVFFGSTSGRFGNQGQADYAAANEVMNRLAWQLDARWPKTRVVVINWGPWSGAGMAGEGTRQLLESRGLTPIEPEAGRRFFADELAFGRKGEVEVIAGDGPWAVKDPELESIVEIALVAMRIRATTGAGV